MKIMTEYPNNSRICLNEITKKALLKHINEPFSDEKDTLLFWQNTSTLLIVIDPLDDYIPLLSYINKSLILLINEALEAPEYEQALPEQYKINLTVFHDDGSGLYLVYPTEYKEQLFNAIKTINNANM